jgi:UDP-N-acetylglucosamine acyltransferase
MAQPRIHPTALIDPSADLSDDVSVGPFTIIEGDVTIGGGTSVASNVLIASGARIGANCKIAHGAVLSTPPQDLKFGGEKSLLEIGDRTVIREYATLNRGTAHGQCLTKVGSDCMLMAYSHVAHDCFLGDSVIMANSVNLAGHTHIQDFVTVGGLTAVHQFVTIGAYAFVGGMARVTQDIPPYALVAGIPIGYHGPNSIGLRRKGFSAETIRTIRRTYSILYRQGMNVKQALAGIEAEIELTPEVIRILDFVKASKRGITGVGVEVSSTTPD